MRWILLACCAGAALAGTDPKPKPDDYPVHADAGGVAIGAEFMVHSFSGQEQTFIAPDYLVVEVALFPPKGREIQGGAAQFTLRVTTRKPQVLLPQAPQIVADALRHPEWRNGPRAEASGGVGNSGVILGRPVPSQLPGPTEPGRRTPAPPRVPGPDNPSGMDKPERVSAGELVVQTAFPDGAHSGPISGFIYFAFREKVSSIKSLELVWGDTVLKLR